MNNTRVASTYLLIREENPVAEVVPTAEKSDLKVTIDRLLVLASIAIIGVFLAWVLHPNHYMLTACWGWAGLWVTDRLSERNAYRVAPLLIFLNLISFPEGFIALPIAALTLGLSQDFQVDESMREAMRLAGLTGAALTLLCMLA
ncbi:MAG TPA: hypothetical protein PKZ32_03120 [Candidatus Melainabacteria bacterium]|nr:hypothetical protein [Candidatus Melainabacteria bacterium]